MSTDPVAVANAVDTFMRVTMRDAVIHADAVEEGIEYAADLFKVDADAVAKSPDVAEVLRLTEEYIDAVAALYAERFGADHVVY